MRNSLRHARTPVVFAFAALALSAVGCGDTDGTPAAQDPAAVAPLTAGVGYRTPRDAAPDPDGANVYFTAQGTNGPGVFRVSTAGGAVAELRAGAPFVNPTGIALGTDGQRIFVADGQTGAGGAILAMPVGGGAPEALAGTAGTGARGLDVVRRDGADVIYFTGVTADTRRPAVFRVPAAGGAPTVVASGAPLVDPSGVAVTRDGVVYVGDRGDGTNGSVVRIDAAGAMTVALSNERVGDPAGVALTPDERTLLVSALDPARGTSRVTLLDLATLQVRTFDRGIGANRASGGLHRAFARPQTLAWCGVTAGTGGSGIVYRVSLY